MAEPTSTTTIGVYGLFVALFGTLAGQWAVIIFASLAGGLWTVGRYETESKKESGMLLLKVVSTAVVFTGVLAAVIESSVGIDAKSLLAPVAYSIGFLGDRWHDVLSVWISKYLPSAKDSHG